MKVTSLESHQLRVVDDLNNKFEEIDTVLENKKITIEEMKELQVFFYRMLQVYNIIFTKKVTNGDFMDFRIENILKWNVGEKMI